MRRNELKYIWRKGSLWGLDELNLERVNEKGVKYRTVMHNFFVEIERCIRLGVAYDLFWDVDGLGLSGYREVVRAREDGKVLATADGKPDMYNGPRVPVRPSGAPPDLTVESSTEAAKAPVSLTANAQIIEGSAAVYYTLGADNQGRYRNVMVAWELYGPNQEDYCFLRDDGNNPRIHNDGSSSDVEIKFRIEQPGDYRLRAATVDMSGRTSVVWKNISIN